MFTFRANASCRLKQEDLKWASLGRESNGDMENAISSHVAVPFLFTSTQVTWVSLTGPPLSLAFSMSPLLSRPKLAHFKSSCFSLQEALARNVNIII